MLTTANLKIIPTEPGHLELILRNKTELGALFKATVPEAWPESLDAVPWFAEQLAADRALAEWLYYLVIHAADRVLIGNGGFKGRPDAHGLVELGYSIIPAYRCRGFATEVPRALLRFAFSQPEVNAVEAHTLPDNIASIRVLQKAGMKRIGTVQDPEDGELIKWRLNLTDYLHV